jgi:DNA (cytosine-5)-methyltransferase 1
MSKINQKLNFIDVFSGAGGLSCGLELAGLNCILGIEIDKNAVETFKLNHKNANVFCGDIRKLDEKKINALVENKKINAIVGGPPCQGFSTVGLGDPKDQRNFLFKEFIRLVKIIGPEFIVIENVTGLLAKKNEHAIKAIFKLFEKMGYQLDVQVMSAENYGVPEKRRRTIFIGSKINKEIIFPKPLYNAMVGKTFNPCKTVGDALRNLKDSKGNVHNHNLESTKIKSPIDFERIKCIPEGCGIRYEIDEKNYFPKKLKLNVDWKNIPENRFRQTKYQRLDRSKPSPTIMTHRHNYFHPIENRYLTPREAASIQSFPNDFIFTGPLSSQWRQIGNAVPPLLGKAIGYSLLEMKKLSLTKAEKNKTREKKSASLDVNRERKKAFVYRTTLEV